MSTEPEMVVDFRTEKVRRFMCDCLREVIGAFNSEGVRPILPGYIDSMLLPIVGQGVCLDRLTTEMKDQERARYTHGRLERALEYIEELPEIDPAMAGLAANINHFFFSYPWGEDAPVRRDPCPTID